MKRIIGWGLLALIVLVIVGISATVGWRPFFGPNARPLTDRKFESTPARLARGEYLTDNLLNCFACHSERDWSQHDVPILAGMKGGGAPNFPVKDLPGKVYPPNISPDRETGAGAWTDDQLARGIREGIGYDGRALFGFMPYENYRHLSDEDLASVIVYLRSIPPVRQSVPPSELIFPVKYLIRIPPEPVTQPVPPPDLSTPVKRGEYLVRVSGCRDCHTPAMHGKAVEGMDLAGGFLMQGPWGATASENITPDPSGIPYYDEALFIEVMRTGYVKARKLSQIMPWWNFRGLTDEDLRDMYAYLQSIPAVSHEVDNTQAATACKKCGFDHGGGDRN